MSSRFPGLVPAFALLAMGTAHAQVANQTGSMAYPQSTPSGQVQIPSSTARDTGSMAYPASPGGVAEAAPRGRDTGGMMTPNSQPSLNTRRSAASMRQVAARGGDPANSMRPDVMPTPAETATARALDSGPAATPVPYTDFMPQPRSMGNGMGRGGMGKGAMGKGRMGRPMHHAMMHRHAKAATPATAAATPAGTPAATPAPAAAPAK